MPHDSRKRALLERLAELGVRAKEIERTLEEPHSRDWEDMAIEREGEEVLERLGAAGEAEIARIRAALGRMARGTYGTCVSCGDPIAEARLDAVPHAALCTPCAARGG